MRVIFHAPYPLDPTATSGSGVRPVAMHQAFEDLGHEVWQVTGHSAERKQAIERVAAAVAAGTRFDLVYSESSTAPTIMTDPDHLPRHPLMDFAFLRRMRRHGAKVGLFYRDIYWKFPGYGSHLGLAKRESAKLAYRYDLQAYRQVIDTLYLPSLAMGEFVTPKPRRMQALPPGHGVQSPIPAPATGVHLLFVGGMGPHYQMKALLEAVQLVAAEGHDVTLELCTRHADWVGVQDEYGPLVHGPVTLHHASGAGLIELYERSNLASLFVKPDDYRNFAAPVKLFEYLGNRRPVLASAGTLAGEFVADQGVGWTIDYSVSACADLLRELATHPEQIRTMTEQVDQVQQRHTWQARAQFVIDDLGA